MDIESILSQIEYMPFCEERIVSTQNLFHISFWNSMDTSQKVRLMQLLENNLSELDGRKPCKVVLFERMPNMATSSSLWRMIKVSKWHLEQGLSYLKSMNAQMYCAIVHKHEHISQFDDAESSKSDEKTIEIRKNIDKFIPYSDRNVTEYVEYRFQPMEYYAHKVSEEETVAVFKRLLQEFGDDDGFNSWFDAVSAASIDDLVDLYNQENFASYTFDEIYQKILDKISRGSDNKGAYNT